MPKKNEQDMELIKKTANAYGTVSEEIAEKVVDMTTEELLNLEEKKSLEEKEKKIKTLENKERTEKADREAEKIEKIRIQKAESLSSWEPKTKLGVEVKNGRIKNIDEILDSKRKILESQIVDSLIELKIDLLLVGQAKGKFGGGKRRAWRQTQRKKEEGNVATFSTVAVVGDGMGHVGIGDGRAKETLPARDKAIRKAKLNIMKVVRTCSSFDCSCNEPHTIPLKVTGKAGSVRVTLIPAPQGTGLVVGDELKKVLKLAGIKDVYSRTDGQKRTTFNLAKACIDALSKINKRIDKK
jgi:small subunit ribosomal protein S5